MASLLYQVMHSEQQVPQEIIRSLHIPDLSQYSRTPSGITLALALDCVLTTNTFEAAIRKAAMRSGNASAVGALTGQLAGAIYGRGGIPQNWANVVERWDHEGQIAARGYRLATRN